MYAAYAGPLQPHLARFCELATGALTPQVWLHQKSGVLADVPQVQTWSEPRPINSRGPARIYQQVWIHKTESVELSERTKQP